MVTNYVIRWLGTLMAVGVLWAPVPGASSCTGSNCRVSVTPSLGRGCAPEGNCKAIVGTSASEVDRHGLSPNNPAHDAAVILTGCPVQPCATAAPRRDCVGPGC